MDYSITLDWLAFTYKEMTHEAARWIQLRACSKDSVDCAPTNGYKSAYRTAQSVVVMWNVDRSEMGYHVILSGSAIRNIVEQQNVDQKTLLREVCDAGGSITRLDLAQDAQNEQIDLDEVYKALERGENEGTARTYTQLHSANGGNTVYVGSRQSEKFIRFYDKASQMGLHGVLWCRLELETKGMVARAMATLLGAKENWSGAFADAIKRSVNLPKTRDFTVFFSADIVPIGLPKLEKNPDRERWIVEQCMPAIVKHFTDNPKSPAVALLRKMLDLIDLKEND